MIGVLKAHTLRWLWVLANHLHHWDFIWLLPTLARLPLWLAYPLARWRGKLNGWTGRDWRSMGLGFRHIYSQSLIGYRQLENSATERQLKIWRQQRFEAEAMDEFEARLISASRVNELVCNFEPMSALSFTQHKSRGLVLLTPHFESFFLGVAFLGQCGEKINLMSSSITHDSRVDPAVQQHFERKYRGLERYLNGGQVVDMENGIRPFYSMLQRHETLVLLGDAPVLPNGAAMTVSFLGGQRVLAAGGLRMAQKTGSDLGGFVCLPDGKGSYRWLLCEPGPADDPATVERIYTFFSEHIKTNPGGWWASDLLPAMPMKRNI